LRNVEKKVTTLSALPPTKCYIRGLPKGGSAHFCLGVVPLIAKKLQHFEISFEKKNAK
jgi:hypothetical protein